MIPLLRPNHSCPLLQIFPSLIFSMFILQLKIERDAGRVFKGWNEGKIYFAPTYKYSSNSDAYAGETATSNKKRRTPAWYVTMYNFK